MTTPAPMYATLNGGTHDDPLQEVADIVVIGGDAVLGGTAPVVNNSTAADVATLVSDYNTLLDALRSRGVIAAS